MTVNEQEAMGDESSQQMPMRERWNHAIGMVETTPVEAVTELIALQTTLAERVSRNETLDDIATGTLSLLAVDHQLGLAYMAIPTNILEPDGARERRCNLVRVTELFHA